MRSVAVPTTRRLNIPAQRAQLRMECIAISRQLVLVAGSADGRRLHAEGGFSRLQNRVRRVAVRAHRCVHVATGHRLAVNAAHIVVFDLRVAVATGLRDVRLVGRACRVLAA